MKNPGSNEYYKRTFPCKKGFFLSVTHFVLFLLCANYHFCNVKGMEFGLWMVFGLCIWFFVLWWNMPRWWLDDPGWLGWNFVPFCQNPGSVLFINHILQLNVKSFILARRNPSFVLPESCFARTKFNNVMASARLTGMKQWFNSCL